MARYYSGKKCKTIIIPPLINPERYKNLNISRRDIYNDPTRLIYVGRPFATDGRTVKENSYKDRLDIAIEAIYSIKDLNFIFNIYGANLKAQYLSVIVKHLAILNELNDKIKFHGKICNEVAINKIAESDFTILLRDANKMTSAGFPTKFVESISCGTPIITTVTSDLQDYVEVGKNGFFVNIQNKNELHKQLRKILLTDKSEINNMKQYCKESKIFSYFNYVKKMETFLGSLIL